MTVNFYDLLIKNTPMLRSRAIIFTQNKFDADDLFQETSEKIIKNAGRFTLGTNFMAWAQTIMRNIFINGYRIKKRQRELTAGSNKSIFPGSNYTVVNEGENNINVQCIQTAINQLNKKVQIPFLLRLEGYSYEEIAEQMHLPMGTIKSRIHFARKQLKIVLAEYNSN
ncbi:MAG: RNA polymerase sigma-70 factor (ECF subfamily) [Paraglaciecola sp.]|jgi:RNA polymerase sigma-70 factor (ECF subfamily)